MKDKILEAVQISKTYGEGESAVHALRNSDLTLENGTFASIIGSSGSGKSTLLKILGGLLPPTTGKVLLDGQDIYAMNAEQLAQVRRQKIGFIFQDFRLFPEYTVQDNILIPFYLDHRAPDEQMLHKLTEILGIAGKLHSRPAQLSGGQQQRVAIARTLAPEPQVLFMDEPLSNLDAKLRLEMRYELQRLHVETGSTFVYVTHDQMEAMTLATKICLINNGVLQQYEAPLTVYSRPNNLFVADFVGNPSINFIEAKGVQNENGSLDVTILDGRKAKFVPKEHLDLQRWFAERDKNEADEAARHKEKMQDKKAVEKSNKDEVFKYHIARVNEDDYALQEAPVITNEDFVIGVRPEALQLHDGAGLDGVIYGAMPTGMESTIKVYVNGFLLTGVVFGSSLFTIGEQHSISFTGHHIMLFDRQSGDCIALGSLETL